MQAKQNDEPESPEHAEKLLTLLADQATEHAIFLLDLERRVTWWSQGAERLFGIPREKAIGLSFKHIFTPEDLAAGISDLELKIAAGNAMSEDDRWHVRADGSTFWSSGALIAIRNAAGNVVAFGKIIRDRTDLKEQITLLENRLEQAQQKDADKDLLFTKLAHELRNVVAGMDAGLRMLGKATEDELRGGLTQMMTQQLSVVRRLSEDVLDIKRLHAGKATLELQEVTIQDVLRNVLEQARARAHEKSHDVRLFCPSAAIRVMADATRLHQMFSNLVDNAIKYTPPNGRIWVKATIEDDTAMIYVEDNGQGIPPQMLSRIFELFTQVDGGVGGGLGIGLALVHELAQLHGGSVQAVSKGIGLGSEFSVRLPLAGRRSSAQPR